MLLAIACATASPSELAPVPNPGRWTVKLEKPPAPPDPQAPRFEVSKEIWVLGTNRYEVTTWSDGHVGQLFVAKDIGFEKSPNSNGDVYILDPSIGAPAPPSVTGWPEFAWIKPELACGKTTYNKTNCVVYEEKTDAGPQRALIDEETRLPVALLTGGRTYVYDFQQPPDKLPGIDAVLGGTLKGYEAGLKKLSVDLKPR